MVSTADGAMMCVDVCEWVKEMALCVNGVSGQILEWC